MSHKRHGILFYLVNLMITDINNYWNYIVHKEKKLACHFLEIKQK